MPFSSLVPKIPLLGVALLYDTGRQCLDNFLVDHFPDRLFSSHHGRMGIFHH